MSVERRGFVTGGVIRSGTMISLKTSGSHMGTNTVLEVGIDPTVLDEFKELEKQIVTLKSDRERVNQALAMVKEETSIGTNISYDKLENIKQLTKTSIQLNTQIAEATQRYDVLKMEVEEVPQVSLKYMTQYIPEQKLSYLTLFIMSGMRCSIQNSSVTGLT